MINPGVIPLIIDNVWQNNSGTATLRYFIDNVDISKPLTFSSTASRVYGDMSNATIANRLLFQTSVADSYTAFGLIPNGIHDTSVFTLFNSSDPDNSSIGSLSIDSSALTLQAGRIGTGSYLPLVLNTGGSSRLTINTSGEVSINNNKIIDLLDPINNQDAATKYYVDTLVRATSGQGSVSAFISGTLGEAVTAGQPVYQKQDDGKWYLARATTTEITNLSVANESGIAESTINFIRYGSVSVSGLPDSKELYLSQINRGTYTDIIPNDGVISYIGVSKGTTVLNVAIGLTSSYTVQSTGTIGTQNLSEVLFRGNSAGSCSIDMNGQQINNLADAISLKDAINLGQVNSISEQASGNAYNQAIAYTNEISGNIVNNLIVQTQTYTNEASANLVNYTNYKFSSVPTTTPALSAVLIAGNSAAGYIISTVGTPSASGDAANKYYVDDIVENYTNNLIDYADNGFLKLDASNDPITNTLQVNNRIDFGGTTEYIIMESW